mmetsp:Transcript_11556/g.36546  ORF Transcript_11556/g.36546 Transcript_11556/m.36546 type:complete len:353 (+) Transcript_11556:735-1793(+)
MRVGGDVADVAALDVLGDGALEALLHRWVPATKAVQEHLAVVAPARELGVLVLAALGHLEEGVVLLLALAHVAAHKILVLAQEHLVPHLGGVGQLGGEVAHRCVHCVPRVDGLLLRVAELPADLGVDAVCADEHVPAYRAAVPKEGRHTVGVLLVPHHLGPGAHAVSDPFAQQAQQLKAGDDQREGEAILIAGLPRVEAHEPLARHPVQEPVEAVARDSAAGDHILSEALVHRLQGPQGVALELDGATKGLVLRHPLEHLHVEPTVLAGQGGSEPTDATTSDEDLRALLPALSVDDEGVRPRGPRPSALGESNDATTHGSGAARRQGVGARSPRDGGGHVEHRGHGGLRLGS